MTPTLRLIARDPSLRLVAGGMALIALLNASVFPYQAHIAIDRLGLSGGQYALVLLAASGFGVAAALGTGIITDQRGNRRQMALLAALAMAVGPALMWLAPGLPAFLLFHAVLLPASACLFGQILTLARLSLGRLTDRPEGPMAILRAVMSLTFVVVLPVWAVAFKAGADVMLVYPVTTAGGIATMALVARAWPRDGATPWADPVSGLSLRQALREIAHAPILLRIGLLGAILAAPALYMALIGLVFQGTAGRDAGDVALFVGLVAGAEVPFMLALPLIAGRLRSSHLIAAGAVAYAAYLALLPLLAPGASVWLLPVLAGLGGAAILTLPIAYLQDQLAARPGTGSALMALQKVLSDTTCAAVFALGTALAGYGLVAALGAVIALAGAAGLLLADRTARRLPVTAS